MPLADMTSSKGGFIQLDGETLEVDGRILRHYGEIAKKIQENTKEPVDLVREIMAIYEGSEDKMHQAIVSCFLAIKSWNHYSLGEIMNYIANSWDGRIIAIWVSIKENNPQKWTFDHTRDVICDEYQRLIYNESPEAAEEWINSIEDTINRASKEGDEEGN